MNVFDALGKDLSELFQKQVCFLCKKGDHKEPAGWDNWSYRIKQVTGRGVYGRKYNYHDICLREVLSNPEQYAASHGMNVVDTAVEIEQILRDIETDNQRTIAQNQEKIRAAHQAALRQGIRNSNTHRVEEAPPPPSQSADNRLNGLLDQLKQYTDRGDINVIQLMDRLYPNRVWTMDMDPPEPPQRSERSRYSLIRQEEEDPLADLYPEE